jgi:hypothetical protein
LANNQHAQRNASPLSNRSPLCFTKYSLSDPGSLPVWPNCKQTEAPRAAAFVCELAACRRRVNGLYSSNVIVGGMGQLIRSALAVGKHD